MNITDTSYHIRQFAPDEVAVYKAMRLEALKLEPGMFGNSYELEASFPQADWEERVNSPKRGCFGLFYNLEVIGITSIIIDKDDPDVAYMTQSYIRKAHRGQGLSAMLYDARINWATANGIKKLTIGHRESNLTSKAANQRYGFKYTHCEERTWPDGVKEYMVNYVLEL